MFATIIQINVPNLFRNKIKYKPCLWFKTVATYTRVLTTAKKIYMSFQTNPSFTVNKLIIKMTHKEYEEKSEQEYNNTWN